MCVWYDIFPSVPSIYPMLYSWYIHYIPCYPCERVCFHKIFICGSLKLNKMDKLLQDFRKWFLLHKFKFPNAYLLIFLCCPWKSTQWVDRADSVFFRQDADYWGKGVTNHPKFALLGWLNIIQNQSNSYKISI